MSTGYLRQAAIIGAFIEKVREMGKPCGETLIQKATYVMKELFGAPLTDEFRIHYYGPYSFQLRDRLASMEADDIVLVFPRDMGVAYEIGPRYEQLRERFPNTLSNQSAAIDFAANTLGPLGVKQLEPLATALFLTKKHTGKSRRFRASELLKIKPYLSDDAAQAAISTIDGWLASIDDSASATD